MKKTIISGLCSLAILLGVSNNATAQNLETKKEINHYKESYIPEFKESVKKDTKSDALGKVEVEIDYKSFDNNATELKAAAAQLIHTKAALIELVRNKTAKEEVEKQLKKVTIVLVKDKEKRAMTFKGGELKFTSNSYELGSYYTSAEIKDFLDKNL